MERFKIEKKIRNSLGRAGRLQTDHGVINTPAFVAVGTKATVKSLTPIQIKETGAQVVLGNTYHLYLEPGEKIVRKAGGIGAMMGWDGPTMTDSGGFQVFSLGAAFNKKISKVNKITPHSSFSNTQCWTSKECVVIDEDGVTFKSPKDGSIHRFTPERSIKIQKALGADIIFAFDECTSPLASYKYQKEALARTHAWAKRSLSEFNKSEPESFKQMLFGIVQGGRFEDLRKKSAKAISKMEFDGFGIGGSFEKKDIGTAVRLVNKILPEEKPRHLLGIGEPQDLFEAVQNGCDLFDCVAPTRLARNGTLYTKQGKINIENAKFRDDFSKIENECECYTCSNFTLAYLAHLFHAKEILANTLATMHNLFFIVNLVEKMRVSIFDGSFVKFRNDFLKRYTN